MKMRYAIMWTVCLLAFGHATGYPLPRPLSGNIINVKDHGARGDGSTDDTAALRSAIAEARALVKDPSSPYPAPHYGVRVLYFPAGQYIASGTLQLYPNVTELSIIDVRDSCPSRPMCIRVRATICIGLRIGVTLAQMFFGHWV